MTAQYAGTTNWHYGPDLIDWSIDRLINPTVHWPKPRANDQSSSIFSIISQTGAQGTVCNAKNGCNKSQKKKWPWGRSSVSSIVYFLQTEHLLTTATPITTAARRVPFAMDCILTSAVMILWGKDMCIPLYFVNSEWDLLGDSLFCLLHISDAVVPRIELEWRKIYHWRPWCAGLLESWCPGVMSNLIPHQG